MTYQAIPPVSGADPWLARWQPFLKSRIPQITRFEYLKIGPTPVGNTSANAMTGDAAREGGAEQGITTTVIRQYSNGIFQTLNTGKWAIAWHGKLAAPVAARSSNIGLINTANTHGVYLRTDNTFSTTKWYMQFVGGTTTDTIGTINADNNAHTFAMAGDAATVYAYVDGVLLCSAAVNANVIDESVGFFTNATTLTDTYVSRVTWGFVDPT